MPAVWGLPALLSDACGTHRWAFTCRKAPAKKLGATRVFLHRANPLLERSLKVGAQKYKATCFQPGQQRPVLLSL